MSISHARGNFFCRGFALPTIMIAAIVMLIVLLAAVSATSSVRTALNDQYYNQLAREAAESGIAKATGCLQENYYIAQWEGGVLHANTSCHGGAACSDEPHCFVLQNGNIRTRFTVAPPTKQATSQTIIATGTTELLRHSSGIPWKTYTASVKAQVGIDLNLSMVAFGYSRAGGAYFGTITSEGEVRAVGNNTFGQLGNGTTNSTLTPTRFQMNSNERAVALFTNFVSVGWNMFALTNNGNVYGAGDNRYGQLGNGNMDNQSTPVQFILPPGKQVSFVNVLGRATFVHTKDDHVYAVGECDAGLLGTDYTISGCTNRSVYERVALPTPTADPNTQPTTTMALDKSSAFILMEGGRVYGWGLNDSGQLGDGTFENSSVPVKIGNYGDAGQPKAVDIAFDGETLYVVDDTGGIKATGLNYFGQLGTQTSSFYNPRSNKCLDNKGQDGYHLQLYRCNNTPAQMFTLRDDGSLYNPNTNECVVNTNRDRVHLQLYPCNGAYAQKWEIREDSLYNPNADRCLNNPYADAQTVELADCKNSTTQRFRFLTNQLVNYELPAAAGNAIKVSSDQWHVSVLTDTGQVWSAGLNNVGQLGNGTVSQTQFTPVQFDLPSGVTATDVYVASLGTVEPLYNNTFVIGSDGRVYGAGDNRDGQLGDGTTITRPSPVTMDVIDGVTISADEVVTGYGTTVVLTKNKKIYTVGNNNDGQLGDGTTNNSSVPRANRYTNVLPITLF